MAALTLRYNRKKIVIASDYEDDLLQLEWFENEDHIKVVIHPKHKIYYEEAILTLPHIYTKNEVVFLNGYQSWTDSKEAFIHEYDKGLQKVPGFLDHKYAFSAYGDYRFYKYPKKAGILHGWNYTYFVKEDDEIELWGSLNENTCYTSFTHDSHKDEMRIAKDLKGYRSNEELILFDLMKSCGPKEDTLHAFFEAQGIKKKDIPICKGYTSWYNYYQDISEAKMKEALKEIEDSPISYDVFQIDDGFETYVGDWLHIDEKKFPNGLKPLVNDIHAHKMKAGIWLAPFIVESESLIYKEHKDWLAKDEDGNYIKAGHNWSHSWALDFYNKEVQDYIRKILDFYKDLGFDFFKLDFLYAIGLLTPKEKTRAMMQREAMQFLRDCLPNRIILGCGVPLISAAELVDYCRVGCDVGPDYDNNWLMRQFHRERVSTKNTLLNTIYRHHLDQYYFGNDPDVYLLRDNIVLTREQQLALLTINTSFATLVFTSDNVANYNPDDKEYVKYCLETPTTKITYKTTSTGIDICSVDVNNRESRYEFKVDEGIIINK